MKSRLSDTVLKLFSISPATKSGIESRTVMCGPDEARMLLDLTPEWHRKATKPAVDKFVLALEHDEFLPGSPIRLVQDDGALVLTDGRARLSAIEASKREVCISVVLICDGRSAIDDYTEIGAQGRLRTLRDRIRALDTTGLMDRYTTRGRAMLSACHLIAREFGRFSYVRASAVLNVLREYDACAQALIETPECFRANKNEFNAMFKTGSLAVALVTMKYSPIEAMQFWPSALANNGLKNDDHRRRLHEAIVNPPGGRAYGGAQKIRYDTGVSAQCWNAYVTRTPMAQQPRSTYIPETIELTPFRLRGWDAQLEEA